MEIIGLLAIKMGSAVAGATLALVFQPPKNRSEFVTRAIFSIISGMAFSTPVRDWLHWQATVEHDIAAAVLTAMLSWFLMTAIVRIIGTWKPKE